MNHPRRGMAIIISNHTFRDPNQNRPGLKKDAERLQEMFAALRFDIKPYENLTSIGMKESVRRDVSHGPYHSEADCFALAILSHGSSDNLICGVEGDAASLENILRPVQNQEHLAGKPKIVIVLACRGVSDVPSFDLATLQRSLPVVTDFVTVFATMPGTKAYTSDTGSVFISTLCDTMKEFCNQGHFLEILTILVDRVTQREKYVCPTFSSQLRKQLWFRYVLQGFH